MNEENNRDMKLSVKSHKHGQQKQHKDHLTDALRAFKADALPFVCFHQPHKSLWHQVTAEEWRRGLKIQRADHF